MLFDSYGYTLFVVFIFGLIIGSFSNACIYRWTEEKSIFAPRSRCPVCNHVIAWYDNIPILSFFLLKGKCRHCHTTISLQYPFVELIFGLAFLAIFYTYGFCFDTVRIMFLFWMFAISFATDMADRIIPNEVCIAGIFFAIISAILGYISWSSVLWGFFAPSVPLLLMAVIIEKLTGHDCVLGGGDLKFLFAIGGVGGAFFSSYVLIYGSTCLAFMFAALFIQDLVTGERTPVPMMLGFMTVFILMFLFGVLPVVMRGLG